MPITVLIPATTLPVGLPTALRYMKVLMQDGDMANLCLQTAVQAVEDYTGRSLCTKTYLLSTAAWPTNRAYWGVQSWLSSDRHIINNKQANLRVQELRRSPLLTVTGIQYWGNGATSLATLDPSDYLVDASSVPGRVAYVDTGVDGGTLPYLAARADAIQITFTAGYGTGEDAVPAMLKMACLMFARQLYDNRLPGMASGTSMELPYGLRHMLRSQRIESVSDETA